MDSASPQPVAIDSAAVEDLICPACGYSLRGITSDRCPECGLAIDRVNLSASHIPWAHRRIIGRWRGYWRTNILVMFHLSRLANEINRPVSFADAQRFRHTTVITAFLPVAAWSAWLAQYELHFSFDRPARIDLGWMLEYVAIATAAFSLWLFLLMITGVGSYFFHSRKLPVARQNRALALSYYACAPLAWLFVPALLLLGSLFSDADWGGLERKLLLWSILLAGAACAVIVLRFWIASVQLLRRTTGCGRRRAVALAIYLPLAWAALFIVCWMITAGVVFVSLVILSFG